jgi:uncharacterized protein (DUF58 family)
MARRRSPEGQPPAGNGPAPAGRFGSGLTREGWLTAALAAALVLAGRLLGAFELVVTGAAIGGLLLVALIRLALIRLQLGVRRTLSPPRVHAGQPARVELHVANGGGLRTPVLQLRDEVTGTRGATLLISPLAPGTHARAAYLLPTEKRGRLSVGPLRVHLGDPFGLSRSVVDAVARSDVIVYPRIDRIGALAAAASHDPQATARQPNALGRTGDDFYALRPYQTGDDLRRVHWPATAHNDELMIRQHELPWQERTTVLLDVRSYAHTDASFELCVSAAASALLAAFTGGDQVRLVTTAGADSGFGLVRGHVEACLERLALVERDQAASLQRSLELLTRDGGGGTLVMVVAALASTDLVRLTGLRNRFGRQVTVLFEPSSWDETAVDQAALPGVPNLVRVTRDVSFVDAWTQIMRPTTGGRASTLLATEAH